MLGNKTFDLRTNKGGEVSLKEGGKHEFVVALDFASMYPYVAESFNIDSSAIIPIEMIEHLKNLQLHSQEYSQEVSQLQTVATSRSFTVATSRSFTVATSRSFTVATSRSFTNQCSHLSQDL